MSVEIFWLHCLIVDAMQPLASPVIEVAGMASGTEGASSKITDVLKGLGNGNRCTLPQLSKGSWGAS